MQIFWKFLTMSLSSKPKKIKRKGTVQELKLVQTIGRRGRDIIKTEEVKTPQHGSRNSPSKSQHTSSPTKRPKMETFDSDPIPCDLGHPDMLKKRQTLVNHFPSLSTRLFDNYFRVKMTS
jgi:hypothetical protein